jgi:hypothetical protein
MGAEYSQFTARCEKRELTRVFTEYVGECQYDQGHGGYTGSMAETDGCSLTEEEFISEDAAEEWLMDNAQKWGPALIVRVTLEGKEPYWLFGAWCSS